MNSRKHHRSKRNPLVRFVRGIFRLLRVLFKPKQQHRKSLQDEQSDLRQAELARHQAELELRQAAELTRHNAELDRHERARLITVGELFEQIKWQMPSDSIGSEKLDLSTSVQTHDVSRN